MRTVGASCSPSLTVVDNNSNQRPYLSAAAIPIGQLFRGRIGECHGVFLRVWEAVVCLSDPSHTWTGLNSIRVGDCEFVRGTLTIQA